MERRFAARRDQLLADAEVDPRIPRGVLARLECFLDPFVRACCSGANRAGTPAPLRPAWSRA